jgi:hypothetical protein
VSDKNNAAENQFILKQMKRVEKEESAIVIHTTCAA